jgi:tocopherol cyclase
MINLAEYFRYDIWRVMRPLAYHGAGKSGPFFEGWYFKLISADGSQRVSIIPGIYIGKDEADSHAFIQVIDGVSSSSQYVTFPIADFSFVPGEMDISIADNHFTQNAITLSINREDIALQGNVRFSGLNPWPVRLTSPGVMGWFAWMPGMECYHGIVSMDHRLEGAISFNNLEMDFNDGHGYMEKDWGRAMPRAWIWMQCNHFEKNNTSFTFSVAEIPYGKLHFTGFLGGLLLDGQLHRFANYTGARLEGLSITADTVRFTLKDPSKKLSVIAHRAQGLTLKAPTLVQMDRRIMETLSAAIDIRFERKERGQWIEVFSGSGEYAGLELVGELAV